MPGPDRDHPDNLVDDIKNVFDTKPEAGSDGIGPTLGQDVGRPNRSAPAAQTPSGAPGSSPAPSGAADKGA